MAENFKYRDVGARLKAVRFYMQKPRQADFAAEMGGFSVAQISNAERGKNPPPAELLVVLARDQWINVNWLLTGRGEMFIRDALHPGPLADPRYDPMPGGVSPMVFGHPPGAFVVREVVEAGYQEIDRDDERLKLPGRTFLPIVDRIAAGPALDTTEADAYGPGDAATWLPFSGKVPHGAFALKIAGDSMEPKYHTRDLVLVDPNRRVEGGEACIYYRNDLGERERVFKVLVPKGRGFVLQSLNPAFKPIELRPGRLVAALAIFGHLSFVKSRPAR